MAVFKLSVVVCGIWERKWRCESLTCVRLFETPWTVAGQDHLSMRFFQARMLEWLAIPFSRESSRPKDRTWASCIQISNWVPYIGSAVLASEHQGGPNDALSMKQNTCPQNCSPLIIHSLFPTLYCYCKVLTWPVLFLIPQLWHLPVLSPLPTVQSWPALGRTHKLSHEHPELPAAPPAATG